MGKTRQKTEFGDWQTPIELAREVCQLLHDIGIAPASVLEPTCGQASFLISALEIFPTIKQIIGIDINTSYIEQAKAMLSGISRQCELELISSDFFLHNWADTLKVLREPILIIGNPPWVTNSVLSSIGSRNVPDKSNFHNKRGIEAITGKSNFDISEWMILQMLNWIKNRNATIAILCKTSVARKVLLHSWHKNLNINRACIYKIDTGKYFEAAVDACLLFIKSSEQIQSNVCHIYNSVRDRSPDHEIGCYDGRVIANVQLYNKYKHLFAGSKNIVKWRSGIKHDCSGVMELRQSGKLYTNGFGEMAELEDDFLYPMLKSSDLAKGPPFDLNKRMLVTQNQIGQDVNFIRVIAPKTWNYLQLYSARLQSRASSIYRNKGQFAIFGVGEYSFTDWKIAISGFYKNLVFQKVGPIKGKPVVFDDTCYFISCKNETVANVLCEGLNSEIARDFFSSLIFWDSKRPITVEILNCLDIRALLSDLKICIPNESFNLIPPQMSLFNS